MSVGIQKSPAIKVPVVPDPIPTPLITQNALVLRPLSGRPSCLPLGIWPLVLCSVIMGPAPANSEANRDRARPWLPSLRDSIPRCSVSAEKVSTITCILEPSSPRSVSSLSQPARRLCSWPVLPTSPSALSAGQQRSRNPEVCSSVLFGDLMGSVLGWFSLQPPPSWTCQG